MGTLEKIKKLVGQGTVVLIPGRLAIMRNWTEEIQKESCGRFADRAGRNVRGGEVHRRGRTSRDYGRSRRSRRGSGNRFDSGHYGCQRMSGTLFRLSADVGGTDRILRHGTPDVRSNQAMCSVLGIL